MNRNQHNLNLLRAALDAQPWESFSAVPSVERYTRALAGREPLSNEEQRQLWRSPSARTRFFQAHQERVDATAANWAVAGVQAEGQRLAAAGPEKAATVQTNDFTLTVQRDETDPNAPEWLLILSLGSRMRDALEGVEPMVAVSDSGGLTWLTATPDDMGVVSGIWPHEGSPVDRLRAYTIRVEPA